MEMSDFTFLLLVFDGNLFSLTRGSIAVCGTETMKSKKSGKPKLFQFPFSTDNKLSPPHCTHISPLRRKLLSIFNISFPNQWFYYHFSCLLFSLVFREKYFLPFVICSQAKENHDRARNTWRKGKLKHLAWRYMFNITLIDDSKQINNKLNFFPSHIAQACALS